MGRCLVLLTKEGKRMQTNRIRVEKGDLFLKPSPSGYTYNTASAHKSQECRRWEGGFKTRVAELVVRLRLLEMPEATYMTSHQHDCQNMT